MIRWHSVSPHNLFYIFIEDPFGLNWLPRILRNTWDQPWSNDSHSTCASQNCQINFFNQTFFSGYYNILETLAYRGVSYKCHSFHQNSTAWWRSETYLWQGSLKLHQTTYWEYPSFYFKISKGIYFLNYWQEKIHTKYLGKRFVTIPIFISIIFIPVSLSPTKLL